MAKGDDETEKKRRKKGSKRRHKKDVSANSSRSKIQKRKSVNKRKLSIKRTTKIYAKKQEAVHLTQTINSWKLRWKNRTWRQRWKYLWGKNRWKPSIRKRWNADKKWRRKWMKKILKKWWDKKWRRKWMKRWIDNRWLTRWNRRRVRRKKLWLKRWKRSGAKKMGLTFNEFLLTERRLKALQRPRPEVLNRRRRERHFQKEKLIREQQDKRDAYRKGLHELCFLDRLYHSIFPEEVYGPETFGIRPAVIQFKFYMVNAIQGLFAFIIVLYFHLTFKHNIPPVYALQGLYTLVYFANAMDFYGSIFGMVTSHHLESYYDHRPDVFKKKKNRGCFGFCKKKAVNINIVDGTGAVGAVGAENSDLTGSAADSQIKTSKSGASTSTRDDSGEGRQRRRSKSRIGGSGRRHSGSTGRRHSAGSESRNSRSHHHSRHRAHRSQYLDTGKLRKLIKNASVDETESAPTADFMKLQGKKSQKSQKKCSCRGLGFLYCSFIRKLFRPGRSREFINRMGYSSWILLQLAWFFNIFFTAYYNWLELYYKEYESTNDRCKIYPRLKHCDDADYLFFFLLAVVGVTFTLRNVFTFVIGMCFSERYLKRCKSADPNDEMASTCSDTDIDCSKVPRQILVPHLLSGGKYPYVLPGPCRPVDYMLAKIEKVKEKHLKEGAHNKKSKRSKGKNKSKGRRRILSTYEKEAAKVVAGFKQVRRTHIPLEKGKRKPWRIPVSAGVTDVHQLPPDLMTTKAWAWLHDESSSTEEEDPNTLERHKHQVKWRKVRRRKPKPIDSAVIKLVAEPTSKSNIPIDEIVQPKLMNLTDRESTDESWSGRGSEMFESVSGYSSEDERGHAESDAYMELMKHGEDPLRGRSNSVVSLSRMSRTEL